MKNSHWFTILLACTLLTGIIGCSNDDTRSDSPTEPLQQEQKQEQQEQQEQTEPDSSGQLNVFHGNGWKFEYPKEFDVVSEDPSNLFIQQSSTGLTVQLHTGSYTKAELEAWIQAEIDRKLSAEEADVTLIQPLEQSSNGDLTEYRYTTRSDSGDQAPVDIPIIILYNGAEMVEFRTHKPPAAEQQFESIVRTFVFE